jgi:hypothetical protein
MRFGVSYNVFDGVEHLRSSILQIREYIDFITVVYQKESNFGNKISKENFEIIRELFLDDLIDDLYEYIPDFNISPHQNELNKRNIGYFLSMENNMNYHMSMDCDEFYLKQDFFNLINDYKTNKYSSGFCQMKTYYKNNKYILNPSEEYFVSLFYEVNLKKSYILNNQSVVLVDPTRRMNVGDNYKIFTREEIEMHHLSYVRKDISEKFTNSSAKMNFKDITFAIDYFNNWKFPQKALMVGATNKYIDVVEYLKLENEISENLL